MGDWELLEAWRGGDAAAGEALVGRYLGLLTRFFRNKVASPEDAADLISETLLACTKGKQSVRDSEAFRSFLFAAAMNMLRRHYRKQAKRGRELDDFADVCVGDSGHPRSLHSIVALEQESRLLVRALRRIPLDQQIVLELSYFEGLSGADIAELLGVPQPTVYTWLRRGKERLRVAMLELAESPQVAESTMMGLQTWAGRVRAEIGR
jgi:RNA polymerase sigma-70 factor (ECF subfamily)